MKFLEYYDQETVSLGRYYMAYSKAQLYQDIFVLCELGFKKNGYFVEFGATDGIELSNTYLLEKMFNWKGLLAEPAACWHDSLSKNRDVNIDFSCVWSDSGERIKFNETEEAHFSTISKYSKSDRHAQRREDGNHYLVNTVSLTDLLKKHQAPQVIDYLSIDTEGSEFEILNNMDFDLYKFRVITCEHNYTSNRGGIYSLLSEKGYTRIHEKFSGYDDWYINLN